MKNNTDVLIFHTSLRNEEKMSRFFKYFRIPLIITVVISIICLFIYMGNSTELDTVRNNPNYDNTTCVYDYAGKMTDSEIASLNQYLYEIETANCVDIAFITIYDDETAYLESMHELTESVAEEWMMGYHGPMTDSVVFVDNWSRGGDGGIHSWMTGTGDRIKSRLDDSTCESVLMALDDIESDDADPYEQYMAIARDVERRTGATNPPFGVGVCFIIAVIVAAIYIFINWRSKLADITVSNSTYLEGGSADFPVRRDIFLNKTVTKTKIESDSSSGGGSHSGGGHSR